GGRLAARGDLDRPIQVRRGHEGPPAVVTCPGHHEWGERGAATHTPPRDEQTGAHHAHSQRADIGAPGDQANIFPSRTIRAARLLQEVPSRDSHATGTAPVTFSIDRDMRDSYSSTTARSTWPPRSGSWNRSSSWMKPSASFPRWSRSQRAAF